MSPSPARNDYELIPIEGAASIELRLLAPKPKTIREEGAKLWKELHEQENPTQEWLGDWLSRIPSYDCQCRNNFAAILKGNPPRFDDWKRWAWEVHNSVNAKLGKSIYPWVDADF
jgi:hypothetical protein